MKLLRITKVDYQNSYEEVNLIPPSAKPVTGPYRIGDYIEMSDHGYIRARYRKEVNQNDFSKISSPSLDWGLRD